MIYKQAHVDYHLRKCLVHEQVIKETSHKQKYDKIIIEFLW